MSVRKTGRREWAVRDSYVSSCPPTQLTCIGVEVTGDTTATANVAKALRGAHLVVTTVSK